MTDPAGTLSYVYAVGRDDDHRAGNGSVTGPGAGEDTGLRGIGGHSIRWVAAAGLRAAVGDVDRAEFTEGALEERLEDLAWLAATARAHHRVVDTIGRAMLVAPLALATVYFDDDRVRAVLTSGRDAFDAVLGRLAGRSEFGLKIYAHRREDREPADRPSSGTAYLRARRQALRDRETTTEQARAAAEEIDRAVAAVATDTRTHRLQDAALSGTAAEMVLNRAYLVPVERTGELAALVDGLVDHPRLQLELTGPWVPYSFVQSVP